MEKQESKVRFPIFPQPRRLRTITQYGIRILRARSVSLFSKYGLNTVFENLEGFPEDWKTNAPAFVQFVREHQRPSFLEYGEYPYVSADEIKKALKLKAAFSNMLDLMQ